MKPTLYLSVIVSLLFFFSCEKDGDLAYNEKDEGLFYSAVYDYGTLLSNGASYSYSFGPAIYLESPNDQYELVLIFPSNVSNIPIGTFDIIQNNIRVNNFRFDNINYSPVETLSGTVTILPSTGAYKYSVKFDILVNSKGVSYRLKGNHPSVYF